MTRGQELYAPLTSVLVATDFSHNAQHALERALLLPLARGATLELLHVVARDVFSADERGREDARIALDEMTAHVRAQVAGRELRVASTLASGQIHVEIIRASRKAGVDLVVLGRHGRRTVKDKVLGTTASRVVRKGELPVLIVSTAANGPYRRPLIATDLHDAAMWVFDVCLRVVGPEVRRIDVVHGYHVPFEGLVNPAGSDRSEYRQSFETAATKRLDALVAAYAGTGVRWQTLVRSGDPRLVVIEAALVGASDVVAIGTHARTGLSHALLGSVAETIVDASPCDVLVSRPVRFSFEPP